MRKHKHDKLAEGIYQVTIPGTHRRPPSSYIFFMGSAMPMDTKIAFPPDN